jgi:hypothetical protein
MIQLSHPISYEAKAERQAASALLTELRRLIDAGE